MSRTSDLEALARHISFRLNHAATHGQTLADSIRSWDASSKIELLPTIADDRRSWELKMEVVDPPLDEWGAVFDDGIHDIRTVLDHLTWGLAMLGGRVPGKPRAIQFPIADSREEWEKQRHRIKELDPSARQAIEDLQPFQRIGEGGGPEADPLILLSELDNRAKHRIGLRPNIDPREIIHNFSVEFASEEAAAQEAPPQVEILNVMLTGSAPLFRQVTRSPIVKVKGSMQLQAQVVVVLDSGDSFGVTAIMSEMLGYVSKVSDYVMENSQTAG